MDIHAWINPALLEEEWIADTAQKYAAGAPFPHIQLVDWLKEEKLKELDEGLSKHKFYHKESDLFSLAQTEELASSENPIIKDFIAFMNSEEMRGWFARITGVLTTQGQLDAFGAIYQNCDYLLPHDDQLEGRKIAFILYMQTLEFGEGGALALYDDVKGHPGQAVKRIRPERNALNLFTVSEESWHEVEEVTADVYRVSIGGWLRG